MTEASLGVDLLLALTLLLLGLAGELLLLVAGDGTNNVVDLAGDLVLGALGVTLSLSGLELSLTLSVLLLTSLLPVGGAGDVADGLLDGTGDGVVVTVWVGEMDEGINIEIVSDCWERLKKQRIVKEGSGRDLRVDLGGLRHCDRLFVSDVWKRMRRVCTGSVRKLEGRNVDAYMLFRDGGQQGRTRLKQDSPHDPGLSKQYCTKESVSVEEEHSKDRGTERVQAGMSDSTSWKRRTDWHHSRLRLHTPEEDGDLVQLRPATPLHRCRPVL